MNPLMLDPENADGAISFENPVDHSHATQRRVATEVNVQSKYSFRSLSKIF
jgi:hypothetical protein